MDRLSSGDKVTNDHVDDAPRGRRLVALRGATTVPSDRAADIVSATTEMLQELMARNEVEGADLVSLVFTATRDLRAEFPAAAARALGLSDVPLLCAAEIDVEGALPSCVRVLVHLYSDKPRSALHHVYLRGAAGLRASLRH